MPDTPGQQHSLLAGLDVNPLEGWDPAKVHCSCDGSDADADAESIKRKRKAHLRMYVAPCCYKCTTSRRLRTSGRDWVRQLSVSYGANNCQDGWVNAISKY